MDQHRDFVSDTAKAAVPIGGGYFLQWIHLHDQQITELSHFFGLISLTVGTAWYVWRFFISIKSELKKD